MNWLDIAVIFVFVFSAIAAFRNGFSREVVRLAALSFGIVGGAWYYKSFSVLLRPYIEDRGLSEFTAFMILFIGSLIAGAFIARGLGTLMGWTGVRWLDRLLGAGFGFIRGLMINAVFILGLVAFTPFPSLEKQVANSRFAPIVLDVAQIVADLAPESLRQAFTTGVTRVRATWERGIGNPEMPE